MLKHAVDFYKTLFGQEENNDVNLGMIFGKRVRKFLQKITTCLKLLLQRRK